MRFVLIFLLVVAIAGSSAALGLVAGAIFDPTSSLFAVIGSMVWTTFRTGSFTETAADLRWFADQGGSSSTSSID